ncbi:MAG: RyR domain-containing protein [Actinomycetota bacterium]|nr:RyR domain-containing protein [Actinomycetota bacterium]
MRRLKRPEQRRQWSDARPLVTAAGFALAVILGTIGYRNAAPETDFTTALFQSLQLFVLEGGVVDEGTPWQLEIARFLAPAVLGYAAIRGVLLVARDQVAVWQTRLFARGHVLVVGTSASALAISADLLADRRRVVVLAEPGEPNSHHGLGERGATVLHGNGADPVVLARARPDRASDVIVAPGVDTAAIQVLAACETTVAGARRPPALHVEITTPTLWAELHSVGLAGANSERRVEFFLVADREARVLLRGAPRTLVLDGRGPVLERLVEHAARRALLDQRSLTIALVGEAEPQRETLLAAIPWLDQSAHIAAGLPESPQAPVDAIVAGIEDALAIASGTELARALSGTTVSVAISDQSVQAALDDTRLRQARVELVPARREALGDALLAEAGIEILARAKHDDYLAREIARGTAADNPSAVPWQRLPESLRESNRSFAASVGAKLDAIGATLAPLGAESPREDLELDEELLEDLARAEHDRWVADLRADGWRHTRGSKDSERKLHPLLVPWEELSEPEREKDRDGVRGLPLMLARAGYRLLMPQETERA